MCGGLFLPAEIAGTGDQVDAAVRKPLLQEFGVDRGHHLVVGPGDDANRRLDPGQQVSQLGQVLAVILGVRDGPREAVAS